MRFFYYYWIMLQIQADYYETRRNILCKGKLETQDLGMINRILAKFV
jgi:hypothetical protein